MRCYSCASKRERRYDENGNKIYPCSNPNIYETVLDSQVTGAVYIFRTLTQVVNAMELLKKLLEVCFTSPVILVFGTNMIILDGITKFLYIRNMDDGRVHGVLWIFFAS